MDEQPIAQPVIITFLLIYRQFAEPNLSIAFASSLVRGYTMIWARHQSQTIPESSLSTVDWNLYHHWVKNNQIKREEAPGQSALSRKQWDGQTKMLEAFHQRSVHMEAKFLGDGLPTSNLDSDLQSLETEENKKWESTNFKFIN